MPYADLVFTGGPVFTANTVRSRTDAVAVSAGRIVAVGGDDVRDLVGPSTEVGDLAHLNTAAEYVDEIGRYAAAHPDDEWILGGGWGMSAFPGGTPTASLLDTVTGDRPAFLPNRDGHGAWVNSAALRLAGID